MTEREIQAAKLSTSRDLAADLAEVERHEPRWRISLLWEGRNTYAFKEYETWRIHLPLVAASAIRRAVAAEAECTEWRRQAGERLRQEWDEDNKMVGVANELLEKVGRQTSEITKLKAENAVLRAALRQAIDPDANPPTDAGPGKLHFSPTRLMELAWGNDA